MSLKKGGDFLAAPEYGLCSVEVVEVQTLILVFVVSACLEASGVLRVT
jgi:hypothetical protein